MQSMSSRMHTKLETGLLRGAAKGKGSRRGPRPARCLGSEVNAREAAQRRPPSHRESPPGPRRHAAQWRVCWLHVVQTSSCVKRTHAHVLDSFPRYLQGKQKSLQTLGEQSSSVLPARNSRLWKLCPESSPTCVQETGLWARAAQLREPHPLVLVEGQLLTHWFWGTGLSASVGPV